MAPTITTDGRLVIDAADLMDTPAGKQRVGDEFHDPDESFGRCDACGKHYRADSWHCCAENAIGDVPQHVLERRGHR